MLIDLIHRLICTNMQVYTRKKLVSIEELVSTISRGCYRLDLEGFIYR